MSERIPSRPFMPVAKGLLKAAKPHTSTDQYFTQSMSWVARRRLHGHILTWQSIANAVERFLDNTLIVTDIYVEDCEDHEPGCPHYKVIEITAKRPS